MTTKKTYSEQLKDPRWQRVRLQKLDAAGWACECCADTESTLHVHHKRYVWGRAPWEYDLPELAVLCESCHETEHETKEARNALLARLQMDGPLGIDDFFAYGSGAAAYWIADEQLREMLEQQFQDKPRAFLGGRIGRLVAGDLLLTFEGLVEMSVRLENDSEFIDRFRQFCKTNGIGTRTNAVAGFDPGDDIALPGERTDA